MLWLNLQKLVLFFAGKSTKNPNASQEHWEINYEEFANSLGKGHIWGNES